MITKNLGGDRLGSGNKMNVDMHGYERSTHDLSYLWKSTMSSGTLVPFMNIVALPGDTFDIELDSIVKTMPTIGPLFGSFKLQLDVFNCPIRLYHPYLHNSKLNIGNKMSQVKLPQIKLTSKAIDLASPIPKEFQQINQSSIFAYLGIRGLGALDLVSQGITTRKNAVPYIAYWDIFKNYYANKQEDQAYVIHGQMPTIDSATIGEPGVEGEPITAVEPYVAVIAGDMIEIHGLNLDENTVQINVQTLGWTSIADMAESLDYVEIVVPGKYYKINKLRGDLTGKTLQGTRIDPYRKLDYMTPTLQAFDLKNIDSLREAILQADGAYAFSIDSDNAPAFIEPFSLPITLLPNEAHQMYALCPQEGLAVKTYQSDIFNNWIQTEWIEGVDSISAITAISTQAGSFTIDTLNLSKKVYDLLNRIAISGGTYEDWIETVFDNRSRWKPETPVYMGGLSKEIVFEQVVSTASTTNEPLGSLAGRGTMSSKHKGGKIIVNVDEPGVIIGIVSITPRLDYSQGNDWATNLQTLDDLHKPALDGIGFQDLITDQMAFWDTWYNAGVIQLHSAGKQPAWLNYMTNYNKAYGHFADSRNQMFMTLNRQYSNIAIDGSPSTRLQDLTTYIDPAKFNYAFAQTDLSAQNFWTQIAVNIEARRKMSAKIIPNL